MLAFACPVCRRFATFESVTCLNCGAELGFDPDTQELRALSTPAERCANATLAACNWIVHESGELCASCALTRTRPNDNDSNGLGGFVAAEAAKRRLLFGLAHLGLPIVGWRQRSGGLAFELLSTEHENVTTGHADGTITLALDETDPAHREQMRVRLNEPYRTVLGHFRHEIGHYYQPLLLVDEDARRRCREIFGDERTDYQEAIDRHYAQGPPSGWEQSFVSAYATMHPWEDWAETFAHYLHLSDTLQTAASYGVSVDGPAVTTTDPAPLHSRPEDEPDDIRSLLDTWIPLTYALNAINRSMGARDLYPFVFTAQIEAKLEFIDELVRKGSVSPTRT